MSVFLIILLFYFFSPFLTTLFIAAIIVSAIHPFHAWLRETTGLPRTLAALLTLSCTIVLVLLPLTIIALSIVQQAADAYITVSRYINTMTTEYQSFQAWASSIPFVGEWIASAGANTPITFPDLMRSASQFVGSVSSFLIKQTGNIIQNLTIFLLHVIVFLMALFYFIRDGGNIAHYIYSLIPLSNKHRNELFQKMLGLMHAIVFGIFGAAVAQGIAMGMGLALAGVENAIFWAAIGAVLSIVPFIGIGIIWIPTTITLFLSGDWVSGLILLIWCLAVVTNVDNIVKPYVIGSSSSLHPFAVLLVLLGGVLAFGFKGLIFGPLVLSLTLAFLHIYQLEYQDILVPTGKKTPHQKKKS